MSRPIPNVTLGGYRPNQVKVNSLGIGIGDETLDALNLDSSQFMVIGEQTNDRYNLIVDSEGVVINSSLPERAAGGGEYALYVDGNIYVSGKVDTSAGTLSNIAGGGGGGAFACNYWMPVRRDPTNIFYDGRINLANESQGRSNNYRLNIVDHANYTINNAQLAIQNQVGGVGRAAILGYSNLSPLVFNTSRGAIEFHAGRGQSYFDSVYYREGQYQNLPAYGGPASAPHLAVQQDGNVGVKVSPNPPLTYTQRTVNDLSPPEVVPTTVTDRPADLHVDGAMYACNLLMYDYEGRAVKNVDDLYVRKLGVAFAASQVEPGWFAAGDYTFRSNVSIAGPTEEGINLSVYGKVHILDQLYTDKAFLTSNLVIQDSIQVNGATFFEGDVIANENVQVNQNLVLWGGLYADSNALRTIIPGGENGNTTTSVRFVGYVADGWSNIYPQGAGFVTPGKVGVGINGLYDTTPGQLSVVSRDSNIYGLVLLDKTNADFTKALFIGHQRSNIVQNIDDASVIFATPSSTSPFFSYTQAAYPQNMYFYPGKYDKTLQGSNTARDDNPPVLAICESGQVSVNSFKPHAAAQFYVHGSIGLASNLYVYDTPGTPTKLAQFRYSSVVGIGGGVGIRYADPEAPYLGIHRDPDRRYGVAIQGGFQADSVYTSNHRRAVLWMDSTTAASDSTATAPDGAYMIGKVGIGLNEPEYLLDIRGDNADIGNNHGTYIRLSKSTLDEGFSNTGIVLDGASQPWFMNMESLTPSISRYSVGCSPDINRLVDTSSSVASVRWSSNAYTTYGNSAAFTSVSSYVGTTATASNLPAGSSNVVRTSNVFQLYQITQLSNVTSNITSNMVGIPGVPLVSYQVLYAVTTTATTGTQTVVGTASNYTTPLAPTFSNITNTSNVVNTSNLVNTSNVYLYLNTSNYVYSSNSTGLLIQHDTGKTLYGHQVVIGGNASLIDYAVHNPNPNPSAVLTVNGDTSILGDLNVTGRITANNLVDVTTSARSNVPTIESDDLFISGKDLFLNPTNKVYVNYTSNMMRYPVEANNRSVLNVYQDIYNSENPAPIAHFVGEGDNTYIEILSKAINASGGGVNDGILRIGLLSGDTVNGQVIGFQDGAGASYMTFRKLGTTRRAMGINTQEPNAQLHIVNNSTSMNDTMSRLTYDNGTLGDTANFTPNLMLEKQYGLGGNRYQKQWILQGPTYGTDLDDQMAFRYVRIVTNSSDVATVTSNTVLSLTSSGCVGINQTKPTYLLDIKSENANDGRNHGIRLWNSANQDIAQLVFQSGPSPDVGGDEFADYVMYSCNSEFLFRQRKSGGSATPLLYSDSNARLGILTSPTPGYDVTFGGSVLVAGELSGQDATLSGTLVASNIYVYGSLVSEVNLLSSNLSVTNIAATEAALSVSQGVVGGYAVADFYDLNVGPDPIVRIAQGGNVGIGTTAPRVALDVIGDALVSGNVGIGNTASLTTLEVFGNSMVYGSVGIGTTTPGAALDVVGNVMLGNGKKGSDDAANGGPFFLQQSWDSAGTTHTISYPTFCVGDNSAGTLYVQVTNKSTSYGNEKIGNLQASFIKAYNNSINVYEINNHKNGNLTTLTIGINGSDIVVTTDSDCSISWTSIGSY